MSQILISVASALVGAALVALLFWRGYSVRPTKMSLPFFEADISHFDSISAVKFFNEVSARVLHADVKTVLAAEAAAAATPVVLIHAGWNLVCEAFVRRFKAYPDDDRIIAAAADIGGQNVEFIRIYREIHTSAVRHSAQVTREFAANYLVRAPSLAERIEGHPIGPLPAVTHSLLASASDTIQSG